MMPTASDFNLPPRTVLETSEDGSIGIVINRKSRIIMADGIKIVEKAEKIKSKQSQTKVYLRTSAPVCSKTIKYLNQNNITIHPL